ncbi:hypothetical protein ADK86_33205 [Streptomyces sp. NRRL F-5755]|uniref:hypothetical protein n=1 Tax=Streptomyces sp. NRRL F-5755 TaxID=1519475 RepID=UPI0006AE2292|nr:hypothetical protein [Streptomyces sp. NRRL F-5755]KOT88198.1 hypothetical protein ADK86_33205 [Streptomyces sp. NRRL F-5755]
MPTTLSDRAARTGALCGALSGLLIALPALVEFFTGETAATSFFLALSPAFALPLLTALHRRQSAVTGHFGETAYVVNLIGLGLFGGAAFASNLVLFSFDDTAVEKALTGPTVPALIGSAAVFAAGSALFGAALLRARVFPRLSSWAYATVLPLFAFLTALPDSALTGALHIVVGATLACLARALWRSAGTVIPRAGTLAGHVGPK